MKISLDWLQDYIEEDLPETDKLVEGISLHGFEIDGVEEFDDDVVLDVDILPNRAGDCLSYFGIAREVAAIFDLTFSMPERDRKVESGTSDNIALTLESENVRRGTKRLATSVSVGESPDLSRNGCSDSGTAVLTTLLISPTTLCLKPANRSMPLILIRLQIRMVKLKYEFAMQKKARK